MQYRPEIDGLRALAVVPVIFFHAGFQSVSGGFVGVDIFFVISGYLITSIILAEMQAGTFTIANFYERRARRILPALLFVMFACLPFAWQWLLPLDMKNFCKSLLAVSFFISNIFFYMQSGYFDTATELKPLLHTWSLGVEEQYYLFFPLLLIATGKWQKRWLLALLVLFAAISLALAQWGAYAAPKAAFFLLHARFWELLLGAFLAFVPTISQAINRPLCELLSLSGLAMIAYAIVSFDKTTPFPGVYALIPTMGAVLIIACATSQTLVGKILGSKPLVGIGLISYSAYLWHQPLLSFARHRSIDALGESLVACLIAATFVLAFLSWKYIETPFRNRQGFERRQIVKYGLLGCGLILAFGLTGTATKGYISRIPESIAKLPEIDKPTSQNGWCFYSVDDTANLTIGEKGLDCWLGDKSAPLKGILFGDSFAGHYEPLLDIVGNNAKLAIHIVTTNWCYPSLTEEFTGPKSSRAFEQCLFNRRYLRDNIAKYDFVILSGSWSTVLDQGKMQGTLDLIAELAAKTKLLVLMPNSKLFDVDVMALYRKSLLYKTTFDIRQVKSDKDLQAIAANRLLEETAQKYPNVFYIDRDSIFNLDGKPSDLTGENIPYSLDGSHISIYGSRSAAASFIASQKYRELVRRLTAK